MALEELLTTGPIEPILTGFGLSLLIVIILEIVLKGLAMYKAARLQEKVWFWCLLVINTAGILPAIYLILRRKR